MATETPSVAPPRAEVPMVDAEVVRQIREPIRFMVRPGRAPAGCWRRHHAPDPRRGGKEFVAVESSLADSAARFSHGLDQAAEGAIPAGLPGTTIHNETGA